MSVRWVESFDNQGPTQLAQFGKWYSINFFATGGANAQMQLQPGRFGGNAEQFGCQTTGPNSAAASSAIIDTRGTISTLFFGFAFQDQATAGASDSRVLQIFDSTFTGLIDLRINASHFPFITRVGTTLCTSNQQTPIGTWVWLEIGVFFSSTAGWVELRQDNVIQASYYGTGTSRATANGNTQASPAQPSMRYMQLGSTVSQGNFLGSVQGPNFWMDDLIFCDNAGFVNNDFISDSRVIGLLPNAVGTYSQMTRVGGTASGNFTAVNENPINGDTSYVASNVPTTQDTYRYPTLPASASNILAVVAEPCCRRDDAGARTLTSHVRSGASESDFLGPTIVLPVQYSTPQQVMENNPTTSAQWLVSEVNAVEVGPVIKT